MSRRKMQRGICRVCGLEKDLSFEHVPPKMVSDPNRKIISVPIMEYAKIENPIKTPPKGKIAQGGIGYHALCRECNSFLGTNYVTPYAKWVTCGLMALSGSKSDTYQYVASEIEPLKILKQIVSMFLSMNNDWHIKSYPELAEFVKDPHSNNLPDKFKVYTYLNNEGQIRFFPFGIMWLSGNMITLSEMTYPPFGYVLTMDHNQELNTFTNITHFKNFAFNDKADITISLKKLPTYLPLPPLDYSTKDEINERLEKAKLAMEKNKQDMKGLYKGFYKYDKERIQKIVAHDMTLFHINITEVDGLTFTGEIKDDTNTGGTPGTGTITGVLNGNKIEFTKQMPIASIISADGKIKTLNKKHRKIYYEGRKSGDIFKGTWKIPFGFLLVGILPIPMAKTTGTWEMEKVS